MVSLMANDAFGKIKEALNEAEENLEKLKTQLRTIRNPTSRPRATRHEEPPQTRKHKK